MQPADGITNWIIKNRKLEQEMAMYKKQYEIKETSDYILTANRILCAQTYACNIVGHITLEIRLDN